MLERVFGSPLGAGVAAQPSRVERTLQKHLRHLLVGAALLHVDRLAKGSLQTLAQCLDHHCIVVEEYRCQPHPERALRLRRQSSGNEGGATAGQEIPSREVCSRIHSETLRNLSVSASRHRFNEMTAGRGGTLLPKHLLTWPVPLPEAQAPYASRPARIALMSAVFPCLSHQSSQRSSLPNWATRKSRNRRTLGGMCRASRNTAWMSSDSEA